MPRKFDRWIFGAAFFLLLVGFIMVLSVSPIAGARRYDNGLYYIQWHILYLIIGALGCFVAMRLDPKWLRRAAFPGFVLSVILLLLTYVPIFSVNAGGASRWLRLGFLPSFQPAEIAKFFVILYVAQALSNKKENIRNFWLGLCPILAFSGLLVLAILGQPDLGTSLVVIVTVFLMLVVAGCNLTDLFLLSLIGFRGIAYIIMRTPYQLKRLVTFLNPWQDPQGAGFNTIQSLIAVSSGGLLGLGIGSSRQKFAYLPENYTDFIFAVICEEGGFWLSGMVIIAFAILVIRGVRLANKTPDTFSGFLALGCSLCLGIQAIVNILVVTAWSPTKGITLPFVSYGGTSLVVSMFMLGVILRISQEVQD